MSRTSLRDTEASFVKRLWLIVTCCALLAAFALPAGATTYTAVRCDPDCNTRVTNTLGPGNEVSLAVNPADSNDLIAAAKDYSKGSKDACSRHNVWAGIYTSFDGGRTWSDQLLPADGLPAGTRCISDPFVMFAADGTAYYYGLTVPAMDLIVERSTDGGSTWEYRSTIAGGADKEWGAVDPTNGRLWAVWTLGTIGDWVDVRLAHSDDGGATWTQRIIGGLVPAGIGTGAELAVGKPGILGGEAPVYLSYWGEAYVTVAASSDLGATWTTHAIRAVAPDPGFHPYRVITVPSIGVDRSTGRVYVAYPDFSHKYGQIHVASGSGAVWTDVPIDLHPRALVEDEFMPALAVTSDGNVHVFSYRQNADGTLDLYYSHSKNGVLWDAPIRVTTTSSDPSVSFHQDGFEFIGDYIGAAAAGTTVYGAWADFRNRRSDVYSAAVQG
jgi:hypothetical protein